MALSPTLILSFILISTFAAIILLGIPFLYQHLTLKKAFEEVLAEDTDDDDTASDGK